VTNEDELHDYNATRDRKVTFAEGTAGGEGEGEAKGASGDVQSLRKRGDGRETGDKGEAAAGDGQEGQLQVRAVGMVLLSMRGGGMWLSVPPPCEPVVVMMVVGIVCVCGGGGVCLRCLCVL
jgi:hypothetical protein